MEALQVMIPYQDVRDQLEVEKKNFVKNFYNIAQLVTKIYNNKLYEYWGFGSFKDFVQESLDLNLAIAYRLVSLVNGQQALEIPTEELLQIKSTNLLEIFSLNPEKNSEEIKALLTDAKTDTTEQIKNKVRKVKGLGTSNWIKFNLEEDALQVVNDALEKAKVDYGDSVDFSTGEIKEISNSRAIELICADYLSH